jgi:hypothetical protein
MTYNVGTHLIYRKQNFIQKLFYGCKKSQLVNLGFNDRKRGFGIHHNIFTGDCSIEITEQNKHLTPPKPDKVLLSVEEQMRKLDEWKKSVCEKVNK